MMVNLPDFVSNGIGHSLFERYAPLPVKDIAVDVLGN